MDRKNMTARELIEALGQIDPDIVVMTWESDTERMCSYGWGISGVDERGNLAHGNLLESYDD